MKLVLAFDSFKGSLDAVSVGRAVQRGITRILPEADVVLCPVADGGEGTVKLLTKAARGQLMTASVHGPLIKSVMAQWGLIAHNQTAILEVAEAAGLTLIETEKWDPTKTTSYGLGELIRNAMDAGARQIIIGLGGSATTDAGSGMAEALGVRFSGCDSLMAGGKLLDIGSVDLSKLDERIKETSIQVALDVMNPLLGPEGTANVFAPQKGATPAQVELLEKGLRHLASFFPQISSDMAGAGAAGGLGWGLAAFCDAELRSGIDLCLDTVGFESLLHGADLVITGEGSFDQQSFQGKVPHGVARRAAAMNIPTAVLAGNHDVSTANCTEHGIIGCYSICKHFNVPAEHAIERASILLEDLAASVIPALIKKGSRPYQMGISTG